MTGQSQGGCLCGAVRYAFEGAPVLVALCHCRHCQRQSGSAFSIVAAVPAESFTLTGETRTFVDRGASGRPVQRVFCPNCGSPLISLIEPLPDMVLIKAGTLDDPSALAPTVEVFCDSAFPFVAALPGAERHSRSNI